MRALRILLVDDDAIIGVLLAEMLADMGHQVCGLEATEAGAVDAALRVRPDLMIVDANLETGSGFAAVETIAQVVAIPHIFISGDRTASHRSPAILLQKPFGLRDLVGAIEVTMAA